MPVKQRILTIFVGGTYSSKESETAELFDIVQSYTDKVFGIKTIHEWEGGNEEDSRIHGAIKLNQKLFDRVTPFQYDVINLIGFSHGGNIAIMALDELGLERNSHGTTLPKLNLVTIATPAFVQYLEAAGRVQRFVNKWLNLYSRKDSVQNSLAGIGPYNRLVGNGRSYELPLIRECEIKIPGKGRLTTHKALPSNVYVIDEIKTILSY